VEVIKPVPVVTGEMMIYILALLIRTGVAAGLCSDARACAPSFVFRRRRRSSFLTGEGEGELATSSKSSYSFCIAFGRSSSFICPSTRH
jgi:hypothetical protein